MYTASRLPNRHRDLGAMPQRVLIVEDDESTRTGLIELLTRAGYAAQGAATLQDARRMVNERAPDLLIADVRLGGFNGLQLLVTRATPIPTIIVTALLDGTIMALDDQTLEELWSINVGTGINAPPMTYAVDGKQYIAIASGLNPVARAKLARSPEMKNQSNATMLFVFALN